MIYILRRGRTTFLELPGGKWEVEFKADDEEVGTSRVIFLSSVEALKSYKNQTTGQSSHILLAFLVSSQNRTEDISGFRPKASITAHILELPASFFSPHCS